MKRCAGMILALLPFFAVLAIARDNKPHNVSKAKHDNARTLTLAKELTIKAEIARGFILPIKCDDEGNVYLLTNIDPSDGIRKISSKGEVLARFAASSAPDMRVDAAMYFSISQSGDLYQIAFPRQMMKRAILVFAKDGSYKSGIVLDNPPGARDWVPSQVAAFSSGDLLVTGLVIDNVRHISTPFTGVFSSSGQLQREVLLSDDHGIQKLVEGGDPHVVRVDHPYSNSAVEFGQMDPASDGNIYLLRNLSPVIVYAVSPAGEVIRRFTVDIDGKITSMNISGNKIALAYEEGETRKSAIKVVDLEGHPLATYHQAIKDGQGELGDALACYGNSPERFTFLGTSDNGFLELKFAEPQ